MKTCYKKIMEFIGQNKLFALSIFAVLIFLSSPCWLRIDLFCNIISNMLCPLKLEGYKSSYIEMVGAILGTFLAVTGALWTQKQAEEKEERRIIKETATIVYYDFKFAFDDLFKFENAYACIQPGAENGYDDLEYFIRYKKGIKIYIDSGWISNVAKLCNILSAEELKQIYTIYGSLETIKIVFAKKDEDIDCKSACEIYRLIHNVLHRMISEPSKDEPNKEINTQLMLRLESIAMGE